MSFARWITLAATLLYLPSCSRGQTDEPQGQAASPSSLGSSERPPPPPEEPAPKPKPPAGPAELAVVAPLVKGSPLVDFEVREIRAIENGILVLMCEKGRSVVRLWIALASKEGPEPPATAGPFAVFYSAVRADPDDAERLARALAAIIAKHPDVPVPPGMKTFVPTPIPL